MSSIICAHSRLLPALPLPVFSSHPPGPSTFSPAALAKPQRKPRLPPFLTSFLSEGASSVTETASMDDFANTEEGLAKAQIAAEGINQLRAHGAFDVQGTMPAEMIEKIFSAGWLTGERWAERQARERDKTTSGSHVEYREGYRDGYKDGNRDGHEASVACLNAPRGPPAMSIESDTTFGSNATQICGSPQSNPALGAILASNMTENRQTTPETQGAATSIDTSATIEQQALPTTSQNQQPEALHEVEETQPSPPPAPDTQQIKVETRQSLSPMDVDGKDLSGNKDITPSLHSKRADSLVDSVEKPTATERPEKPDNPLKRLREVVESVENHVKSEHHPKRPKEEVIKGTEGKRKKITASSLGNFVYSSEDGLDTKDLLMTTCADSLRRRPCQLGPNDDTNCSSFHLCVSYNKDRCPYPTHHGNLLHLPPTCISVIRNRPCFNPHDCGFGHDHPEVRVRKYSSLNAMYLDSQARGRSTTSTKRPEIPDRPAADRIAARDEPSRERRPVAERSRPFPSGPAADRWPPDHSPRR
ncbi:hypothetical protein IWX90DRAFT_20647 [Phyllosticta citrichinensis]|uniref:C3H1-type domain-containing protein n=1 Tax=Phyllosticta citrichinensis TaxID=1130410 RepID=A0ABR1Y6L2_9PEZI